MSSSPIYDFAARQREKAASRARDEARLASGEVTREELARENGAFAFPNVVIDWDAKTPLR